MIPLKDNIRPRRFPVLTVAIIAANVLVYFVLEPSVTSYGAIPCDVAGSCVTDQPISPWLTPLTSAFMHGGLLHLAFNMLFLWIFGNNIEDSMSPWRFVLFYIAAAYASGLAQVAIDTGSHTPAIGASGAVAAIMGAYALLYPRARIVTLIFIVFFATVIEVPALIVIGIWALLQLTSLTGDLGLTSGVAYLAHIGGFVFGLAAIKLFANRVHSDYEQADGRRLPAY